MTHEELMAKIQSEIEHFYFYPWTMLRAIAELHKPIWDDQPMTKCSQFCDSVYPCPTIQAIEKHYLD